MAVYNCKDMGINIRYVKCDNSTCRDSAHHYFNIVHGKMVDLKGRPLRWWEK